MSSASISSGERFERRSLRSDRRPPWRSLSTPRSLPRPPRLRLRPPRRRRRLRERPPSRCSERPSPPSDDPRRSSPSRAPRDCRSPVSSRSSRAGRSSSCDCGARKALPGGGGILGRPSRGTSGSSAGERSLSPNSFVMSRPFLWQRIRAVCATSPCRGAVRTSPLALARSCVCRNLLSGTPRLRPPPYRGSGDYAVRLISTLCTNPIITAHATRCDPP